jgi:serine/threonine protein phosphatase PrpC
LWDVTSGEEAMQIVEGMDSVEDMASCLVRTAVSSSLCSDNVTVVVARL